MFSNDERIATKCFVDLEKSDNPWYIQLYLSVDIVYKIINARVNEIKTNVNNKFDANCYKNAMLSNITHNNSKITYFSYCMFREIIQEIAFNEANEADLTHYPRFIYDMQDVLIMSSPTNYRSKEYVMVRAFYNSRNIDDYEQKQPLEMTDSEIEFMFMQMTTQIHTALDNLMPMIIAGDLLANTDPDPDTDTDVKNDDSRNIIQ